MPSIHQVINRIAAFNWEYIIQSRKNCKELIHIRQLIKDEHGLHHDLFLQENATQDITQQDILSIIESEPFAGIADQWIACYHLIEAELGKADFLAELMTFLPNTTAKITALKTNLAILKLHYAEDEIDYYFDKLLYAADVKLNLLKEYNEKIIALHDDFIDVKNTPDEESYQLKLSKINQQIKQLSKDTPLKKLELKELTKKADQLSHGIKVQEIYKNYWLEQKHTKMLFSIDSSKEPIFDKDDPLMKNLQTLKTTITAEWEKRVLSGEPKEALFELLLKVNGLMHEIQELYPHSTLGQKEIETKPHPHLDTLLWVKKRVDFFVELSNLTHYWKDRLEEAVIEYLFESKVINLTKYQNDKSDVVDIEKLIQDCHEASHPLNHFKETHASFNQLINKLTVVTRLQQTLQTNSPSIKSRIIGYFHLLESSAFSKELGIERDDNYQNIKNHGINFYKTFGKTPATLFSAINHNTLYSKRMRQPDITSLFKCH